MKKESRIQNVHPTDYQGQHFRSTLEAKTAETLDAMGVSYRYEERKITLQEGFRTPYQKDKVRAITYTPDFEIGPLMLECKGFETPEWKIKKKMLFKYLAENEPETIFYQIKDNKKQLLTALDPHWQCLGYTFQVTPQPKKKSRVGSDDTATPLFFDSIQEAMSELHLNGKSIGAILASLTGKKEYVYGYNWKLKQLKN